MDLFVGDFDGHLDRHEKESLLWESHGYDRHMSGNMELTKRESGD